MESEERVYWTHEASTLLNMGTSTLRKYCLALESKEYAIVRDENGRRAFFDKDILSLRDMKRLVDKGVTLEDAAKSITAKQKRQEGTLPVRADSGNNERSLQAFDENPVTQQFLNRINEIKSEITNEIRIQNEQLLKQALEERDKQLEQAMDEIAEMKQMVSAVLEKQEELIQTKKRKKIFGIF